MLVSRERRAGGGGRGGADDAALLPVRRHGEHGVAHGVDRGAAAHPHQPALGGYLVEERGLVRDGAASPGL
ncbi:Protein of unknown function [Gryllus bimaculatus]|nr:Protein of unknown function [Gryllus bimaculatus]